MTRARESAFAGIDLSAGAEERNAHVRAIICSGGGDYTDPWHPFEQTSAIVADLLSASGFDVEVTTDVEADLAGLVDGGPNLMVLNCGTGGTATPRDAAVEDGVLSHLKRGGGILALHVASTIFTDWPQWEEILGGRWIRGTTMHPTQGPFTVSVRGDDGLGLEAGSFETVDEAYTYLHLAPTARVLATNSVAADNQPIWWLNGWGSGRVAYDALGHDEGAYAAPRQKEFIQRAAMWCVGN